MRITSPPPKRESIVDECDPEFHWWSAPKPEHTYVIPTSQRLIDASDNFLPPPK
jgi:hypothetical protein